MAPVLGKDKKKIRMRGIDPWQENRQQRIAFIKEQLKVRKEVDEKQFLGYISTEYGPRRQTLKEYLKDLQDYGVIEIVDGKIKWVGKGPETEEG